MSNFLKFLSSSGPGPGPRSGPGQVSGQVQKVVHVLYFVTTLDKKGIGTLLVDEDDIKRASESLQ